MEISDEYVDKLRAVFDLCDTKKQNFISVQHFIELAKEHFGAVQDGVALEPFEKIVALLDPDGNGKIHFKEFCQGVQQILQLKSPSSERNHGEVFAVPHSNGQEDYIGLPEEDANSSGTHDFSELSTFNEYDMTDDDQSTLSTHTDHNHSLVCSGYTLEHPAMSTEDDHDSAISSRSADFQDQDRRVEELQGEEFDRFDCFSRSSLRHSNTSLGRRKLAPAALADLLGSGVVDTAQSCCSDDIFDDIDGSFNELNSKVVCLESQIQELTDNQKKSDEKHVRMKEENNQLVERVHMLEEQLRDVDNKSQQLLIDEQKKHRNALNWINKDKTTEIELLTQSLRHMEGDYEVLKEEVPRLKTENERLRKARTSEKVHMEEKLSGCEERLSSLVESHEALQSQGVEERSNMEQERLIHAQLLDELTKELEELRLCRSDTQGDLMSLPSSLRREYDSQISHLKQEVLRLREQNEDMQTQLFSSNVQGGRKLLQSGAGMSLADEITNLPKDELIAALTECQEVNGQLREYLNGIILRILETDPTLLEISDKAKKS
ncbi:Rab11 family-interacting protein 4A [Lamellibrachia satsuma]|nr:Rab11 family-interacting protein 4A [Lamellibrachia satsuma]